VRNLLLVFAAIGAVGCGGEEGHAPPPLPPGVQPNVVWIVLDAARVENFSWHGYERETTPFIDSLTKQGAAFHRHYAQAPATLYSVSSYLSGRYFATSYHDDVGMQAAFRVRPDEERLVSEIASQNAYHTAGFSTSPWFYETSQLARTFDEFQVCRSNDGAMEPLDDMAVRIESWLNLTRDNPFFLYIHAMDTHFPHEINPDVSRWYPKDMPQDRADALRRGKAAPPFNDRDREYLRAVYDGGLRQADSAVKRICGGLKDAGVWDQTILVISSDHGELLGEDGQTLQHPIRETQHSLFHTPLVIRGPGITAATRIDELTENVDIVPTLADLASWRVDAEMDGKSLRPLWSEENTWVQRPYAVARSLCFASLGKPTIVLINESHQFVHVLCSNEDQGLAITKGDTSPTELDATKARAFLDEDILPKWDALAALPQLAPPVQQRPFPRTAKPASSHTTADSDNDNKWTLDGGVLSEGGTTEDAPPINFSVPVHAGRYRVIVEAEAAAGTNRSLQFQEEMESAFRTIEIAESGEALLGEYEIRTDAFRFTIDDTPDNHSIALHAIRFERPTSDGTGDAVTPAAERMETLRSLGYAE